MRTFSAVKIGEDCKTLTGHHENELLFECEFEKLTGLTLRNCDLNRSRFTTKYIRDALGLTVTLDCHSFQNVELSPLLFDLMLALLTKTTGNDHKREQLIGVIGEQRYEAFKRALDETE